MMIRDGYQDVRLAVRLWPWCLERWKRIDELIPGLPLIGEPMATEVADEIRGLLGTNQDEMMGFLGLVLPRDEFPWYWAYPDPASLRGTPIHESEDERQVRAAKAKVGANPLTHAYPGLLTDIQARTLAATVASTVVGRATNAARGKAGELQPEATVDGPTLEDVSQNAAAALEKYGSATIAFVEDACRNDGEGIGVGQLAEKTGIGEGHLRNNVLAPLRQLQLIAFDDSSKKWMTNAKKKRLSAQRTRAPRTSPPSQAREG